MRNLIAPAPSVPAWLFLAPYASSKWVTGPSYGVRQRNGRCRGCGGRSAIALLPRACNLLLQHRLPAIRGSFAPPQNEHCRKNGIIIAAPPPFVRCHSRCNVRHSSLSMLAVLCSTDQPANSKGFFKSVSTSALAPAPSLVHHFCNWCLSHAMRGLRCPVRDALPKRGGGRPTGINQCKHARQGWSTMPPAPLAPASVTRTPSQTNQASIPASGAWEEAQRGTLVSGALCPQAPFTKPRPPPGRVGTAPSSHHRLMTLCLVVTYIRLSLRNSQITCAI